MKKRRSEFKTGCNRSAVGLDHLRVGEQSSELLSPGAVFSGFRWEYQQYQCGAVLSRQSKCLCFSLVFSKGVGKSFYVETHETGV